MRASKIKSRMDGYVSFFNDIGITTVQNHDKLKLQIPLENVEITTYGEDSISELFSIFCKFSIDYKLKNLLELRYGLLDGVSYTLSYMSQFLGLSDEYIRSQINKAKRKIKHRLNIKRVVIILTSGGYNNVNIIVCPLSK